MSQLLEQELDAIDRKLDALQAQLYDTTTVMTLEDYQKEAIPLQAHRDVLVALLRGKQQFDSNQYPPLNSSNDNLYGARIKHAIPMWPYAIYVLLAVAALYAAMGVFAYGLNSTILHI